MTVLSRCITNKETWVQKTGCNCLDIVCFSKIIFYSERLFFGQVLDCWTFWVFVLAFIGV